MNTKFKVLRLINGYQLVYHDKCTGVKAELNFYKEGITSTNTLKKLLALGLLFANEAGEIFKVKKEHSGASHVG